MDVLPPELIADIVEHIVDKYDLWALTAVSRRIQPEAELALYRSLVLQGPSHVFKVCTRLLAAPRTAFLVRSLAIICDIHDKDNEDSERIWPHITGALSLLNRLHTLSIHCSLDATMDIDIAYILDTCVAPNLRVFSCDFAPSAALLRFLATHPTIEDLELLGAPPADSSDPHVPHIPPAALPRLRVLRTASMALALALVPGRPVTHVWLPGANAEAYVRRNAPMPSASEIVATLSSAIAALGRSTGPVRSLRLNLDLGRSAGKNALPELLGHVAEHMPGLTSLGFLPAPTGAEGDAPLFTALSSLTSLRTLALHTVLAPRALDALARAYPALRAVACLHYSPSHEYLWVPVNVESDAGRGGGAGADVRWVRDRAGDGKGGGTSVRDRERPRALHDPGNMLWRLA